MEIVRVTAEEGGGKFVRTLQNRAARILDAGNSHLDAAMAALDGTSGDTLSKSVNVAFALIKEALGDLERLEKLGDISNALRPDSSGVIPED